MARPRYTIDELNQWAYEPYMVCKYQLLLVTNVKFLIEINNIVYRVVSHRAFKDRNQLLIANVDTGQQKMLQSGGAGGGYSLQTSVLESSTYSWPRGTQDVCIMAGHTNFAHFMWNQVPGILQLTREREIKVCQVNLKEFIDLSKHKNITIVPDSDRENQLTIYIGGMYVTSDTVHLLHNQHNINTATGSDNVVICLGVRGSRFRVIYNELEMYMTLLEQLDRLGIHMSIYIDGITRFNHHKAKIDDNILEGTIQSLVTGEYSNLTMKSIHNTYFSEWVHLAKRVDYYVTHVGTMQHKFGWLFNDIAGTVIGFTAREFVHWANARTWKSEITHILNKSNYAICNVEGGRNDDCSFSDPERAAQLIFKNIADVLSKKYELFRL